MLVCEIDGVVTDNSRLKRWEGWIEEGWRAEWVRRVEGECRGTSQGERAGMKVVMGRGVRKLGKRGRFLDGI